MRLRSSRRNFLQLEPDKTHYVNQHVADSTPVIAAPLAPDLPRLRRQEGRQSDRRIFVFALQTADSTREEI
jgi:hypothetical protein